MDWHSAANYCQERGDQLVMIRNEQEQTAVSSYLSKFTGKRHTLMLSYKNAPILACCRFHKHGLILVIFIKKQHQHTFRNDVPIQLKPYCPYLITSINQSINQSIYQSYYIFQIEKLYPVRREGRWKGCCGNIGKGCEWWRVRWRKLARTYRTTRNSAVADKPRDPFVHMEWRGWPPKTPPSA